MKAPSIIHHYVPQWYQKLFLLKGQSKFNCYYDLKPEAILNSQKKHNSKHFWGPRKCFCQDNLYSIFSLEETDFLETYFFGGIDKKGSKSLKVFLDNRILFEGIEHYYNFLTFMGVQRLRTPRGLKWLKKIVKVDEDIKKNNIRGNYVRDYLLYCLTQIKEIHSTMWIESIFEVVSAENSDIKFIITDNPITFYNPSIFPKDAKIDLHLNLMIDLVGTRTIFPLDINHCLIITNREYAINSHLDPLKRRTNARIFGKAIGNLLDDVIRGRNLNSTEVSHINFILKKTTDRYLAAADPEWLAIDKKANFYWPKLNKTLLPKQNTFQTDGWRFYGGEGWCEGHDLYGNPVPEEEIKEILNTIQKLKEKVPSE